MSSASATATRTRPSSPTADGEELPDYCARPACRREFRRLAGPGRRQAYCSEVCRRAAERELRHARSRLRHFEELVEQCRADVASFGHAEADDNDSDVGSDPKRRAELAVARAAGIVEITGDAEDPIAREFRQLYLAVVPLLRSRPA